MCAAEMVNLNIYTFKHLTDSPVGEKVCDWLRHIEDTFTLD
jgi:hypothetical protein